MILGLLLPSSHITTSSLCFFPLQSVQMLIRYYITGVLFALTSNYSSLVTFQLPLFI